MASYVALKGLSYVALKGLSYLKTTRDFLAEISEHVWKSFIYRGNQLQYWLRFQPPTCHHYSATSPCCTATPPGSPWRTRSWAPPRWHRQGRPPDRIRSRCTWSCRCRILLFSWHHRFSPQLRGELEV